MRINKYVPGSILAAASVLLLSSMACAQEYKIKITRPAKAGDQYTTSVTASFKNDAVITLAGGAPPQKNNQDFTADLQGVVTVDEVSDKNSMPKKLSCKVDHFTKDGKDLYPAGAVIVAERKDGKAVYSVDGKPVAPQDIEMFVSMLDVPNPDKGVTDDQATGTDKPQKVGDTWAIDPDAVAKQSSEDGMKIDAADVKGEGKLVKVKKLNGNAVMVISINANIDKFGMEIPMLGHANGDKMTIEQTITLPVDETKPGIGDTEKIHLTMKVDLPNGAGTANLTGDREVTITNEPVK
jgi:hypothetical protein